MRTAVRRFGAAGLLLMAAVVVMPSGRAGAQGAVLESIKRYDVQIQIQPSGSMLVTETIDYDFGSVAKHGIFRDIPERLHDDDTYDRIYRIDVVSVKAVGLAALPPDTSWYVSSRPFVLASFADQMDGFTVTTSGTISSTPAGSGAAASAAEGPRAAGAVEAAPGSPSGAPIV